MTRTTLTPTPTIDTVLDALRRDLSPFAGDFCRHYEQNAAIALIGNDIVVTVAYETVDDTASDGNRYGEATVIRCTVECAGMEMESFTPRSANAAANWLHRQCADYADAIAGAQP